MASGRVGGEHLTNPSALILKLLLVALTVTAASSCAPRSDPGSSIGAQGTTAQNRERPTLTLAIPREPTMFNWTLLIASESSNGLTVIKQIPHNQLMTLNDRGTWIPRLAAERISVESGTWRVNPDGTMDTIWKLRPNIRWHD